MAFIWFLDGFLYGFYMAFIWFFIWFLYGFYMVFRWFLHGFYPRPCGFASLLGDVLDGFPWL